MNREKMLIQALKEAYSSDQEEINLKLRRGGYRFYPNKTIEDVAIQLASTKPYKYYRLSDGEIDVYGIINDLFRIGYEETSTGVIML